MAYKLVLTERDVSDILFVGHRYAWSDALCKLGVEAGENDIQEHDAWTLRDAFEADCEGRHSPFPMIDERSDLAEKLFSLWNSIG